MVEKIIFVKCMECHSHFEYIPNGGFYCSNKCKRTAYSKLRGTTFKEKEECDKTKGERILESMRWI